MKKIGVLALQGAVTEHLKSFKQLEGVASVPVRTMAEIDQVDGLVLPGGESTAIGKLLQYFSLLAPLQNKIRRGFPVWGTCAGLILLAREIKDQEKTYLSVMDIKACRNGYGGQLESFRTEILLPDIGRGKIPLVFIRAPYIESVGEDVQVLATVDGRVVAARQQNMLATAFHPELTADGSFHRYFLEHFVR